VVLSARRAIACVDYLAERGIDRSRLIAVGYGDKKILNECEKEVPCPEPEQAVNRRTEFKVLKMQ
jgi:outer membrane protein OmpA-like peptidoglycan-associated protein